MKIFLVPICLGSSAIYSNAVYMKLLDPGVKTIRFQYRDSWISLHVVYLVDIFILLDYCYHVWDRIGTIQDTCLTLVKLT